jgi:hypothetical protein
VAGYFGALSLNPRRSFQCHGALKIRRASAWYSSTILVAGMPAPMAVASTPPVDVPTMRSNNS